MTSKDISKYNDPDDFEQLGNNIKYPCSTNRMIYRPLVHKYYLLPEALQAYGIDVERNYISDAPDKLNQFIEEVTEDVYGVIMRLAPFNYRYHCYQIAQSRSLQFPDRYAARQQFEKALLYQAHFKINTVDVRDINGIDLETGNNIYFKTLRREFRHMSAKTLDILQLLGLLFNGNIPQARMINYNEVM